MKPTSRCIDIRQEHPLLEKFKEWWGRKHFKKPNWIFFYYGEENGVRRSTCEATYKIITLDQRRERRGKEYYEGQKEREAIPEKKDFPIKKFTEEEGTNRIIVGGLTGKREIVELSPEQIKINEVIDYLQAMVKYEDLSTDKKEGCK